MNSHVPITHFSNYQGKSNLFFPVFQPTLPNTHPPVPGYLGKNPRLYTLLTSTFICTPKKIKTFRTNINAKAKSYQKLSFLNLI